MPFTISHIAAALPFAKKQSKLFFPAIAIGTMAPDFEYFLRTKMFGIYGHTVAGVFVLDLPLVILIYLLGHLLVIPTLMPYLPRILQFKRTFPSLKKIAFWFRFCISALLGIFSHLVWDSFTHATGFMVSRLPFLGENLALLGYRLPIYKILQYGSGGVGFIILSCYLLYYQHNYKVDLPFVSVKQKVLLWTVTIGFALTMFILWYIALPIPIKYYGSLVIRMIDSACCSVIILTLFLKFVIRRVPKT